MVLAVSGSNLVIINLSEVNMHCTYNYRFNQSDVVIVYSGNKDFQQMDKENRRLVRAFPEQRFVFHFFEQPFYWEEKDLDIIDKRVGGLI